MEYYSAVKPFATVWMDLENITLSEIVTERQIPHFTHTWNLRTNLTNKQNRDRLTDTEQMTAVRGNLAGRRIKQKGKRTHGHGQQYDDCWGLNGNGKKIQ